MKELPTKLKIEIEGKQYTVSTKDYIQAKIKDLKEFGYTTLTENEVKEQLLKIMNGEELNIIGMFMEGEELEGVWE